MENPDRPEDAFAVTPTDALQVARREVIAHRTGEISQRWAESTGDSVTQFYILAQDGAGATTIPFDEANLFARAIGLDLSSNEAKRILVAKGDKVTLKSARDRFAENIISPQRPAQTALDQVHTAIAITNHQGSAAAQEWLTMQHHNPQGPEFKGTMEALIRGHEARARGPAPRNQPLEAPLRGDPAGTADPGIHIRLRPRNHLRMSLRDISFQSSYNSDNCSDIIGSLYQPALAESVRYDRTTYGFSPAGLINAAAGIAGLVRNGGRIQLICDQTLDADMVQAVIDGRIQAADALRDHIPPESLTDISSEDIKGREQLELVTWMVKTNLLEIKVAIRASGIFHPKIGILTDPQDNRIAFNGSANESIHGWDFNYEYLDVFCSWDEPRRVADKEEQFRQLWEGRSRGAIVIPIPDDYQEYLKQVAPQTDPTKPKPPPVPPQDERDLLWGRIRGCRRQRSGNHRRDGGR